MTNCPCCSAQMQRYIGKDKAYWFCRHCWQQIPLEKAVTGDLSGGFIPFNLEGKKLTDSSNP